ncbi:LysR family transcriptional regulator [Labrenzia sp. DG1229]|uniref:LysR family transcriptional regulator n=1 Tax=Labrenzia sp. DG1229 TaxID=681847 RepID=UPI00155DABB0|nr:LysR family transcriptional regulator [Labrenzia sp. DG1229]
MSTKNNGRPDIRSMEAFAAVVRYGSMTAAAQTLSVSQPAVTRMVRDLEARVGFALFERNGPKISPTEKGIKFFEESQRVMANLSQLTERAHAIRDERIAAIDIVATPTMSAGLVGPVLSRVSDVLPDFVHVETTTSERVLHALRQRTADLGFSAYPGDHDQLKCLARFESLVVAVVKKGSRLDGDGPIPLSIFNTERLATICNGYGIRDAINRAFEKQKIKPSSEIATNSSLSAAMAARAGLGVALCDPVTALGVPVDGVSIRPLSAKISYAWGLFANDDNPLKDRLNLLVDACMVESERIVQNVNRLCK